MKTDSIDTSNEKMQHKNSNYDNDYGASEIDEARKLIERYFEEKKRIKNREPIIETEQVNSLQEEIDKDSRLDEIDKLILKAFKKAETENPFVPVTIHQIEEMLKDKVTRRTIYNHIDGLKPPIIASPKKGLIDKGHIVKLFRGQYSSKMAQIARKIAQRFVVAEVYDEIPKIHQFKTYHELLELESPELKKLSQKEKKLRNKNPLAFLFSYPKWDKTKKKEIKTRRMHEKQFDKKLDFIQKNSEISILSKRHLNNIQKMAVVEKSAELILKLLEKRFERNIEDVSFNIMISYNPEVDSRVITK